MRTTLTTMLIALSAHRACTGVAAAQTGKPGRIVPVRVRVGLRVLRAIGRCAHTRDPAREAAQRSMPVGLARVRHSMLAQRTFMERLWSNPPGGPMTLGSMRQLGVQRASAGRSRIVPSPPNRLIEARNASRAAVTIANFRRDRFSITSAAIARFLTPLIGTRRSRLFSRDNRRGAFRRA